MIWVIKKPLTKNGNSARIDPSKPGQINGKYYTNTITYNKTLADGSVVLASEGNAEQAREDANIIRLS